MNMITLASRSARGSTLIDSDIRTYSHDQELINERRRQIVRGSTKLFVKKGFDGTTMREVAKACKLSSGSLYHYVGSKQDILSLIIGYATLHQAEYVEKVASTLQDVSPEEALQQLIEALYKWHDSYQDISIFIYQETRNLPQKERQRIFDTEGRIISVFEELLSRGIESGGFKISNPKLVAHNIVFLAHGWALRRWFLRKHSTIEDYIKNQVELILSGLGDKRAKRKLKKT